MKKIASLILIFCMILTLCSCKDEEKAQAVVDDFFIALQNNDQETAKSCLTGITNQSEKETISDDSEAYEEWNFADHFTKAFTKITYNISSAERDENDKKRVNIMVDVTAVDMATLFNEALSEAINASLANIFNSGSDTIDVSETANDYFAKSLDKEDTPFKTTTVTLSVLKTDEGMKIETSKDLGDAVTGGLLSFTTGLSQSAN